MKKLETLEAVHMDQQAETNEESQRLEELLNSYNEIVRSKSVFFLLSFSSVFGTAKKKN
jgi:hypothetical protein